MSGAPDDGAGARSDDELDPVAALPRIDAAHDERAVGEHFVHGLLRAMHTADAAAHDARVRAILLRVHATSKFRHRAAVIAASVLALVAIAVFAFPSREAAPRVEALVRRAAERAAEAIDRRYELEIGGGPAGMRPITLGRHALTVRPGGHFLLELGGLFGKQQIGSDGVAVWGRSHGDERGWEVAIDDNERLAERLRQSGMLDLGYLDLGHVIERLHGGVGLRLVGKETRAGSGASELLRIEADTVALRRGELEHVVLHVDGENGHVVRAEFDVRSARARGPMRMHVAFSYAGEAVADDGRYRRPW